MDDMINCKNFVSNLLKIENIILLYKHISIYYIGYITKMKGSKYVNIHIVNPLYFIVDEAGGFIEQKEGNKYSDFAFTDNNKELLKKYAKLSKGIKNLIKKTDNKPGEYGKDYIKIKTHFK